jgi:RND superfamily putative drug exporter
MFAWWGRAVVRWRWGVLGAGLILVLVGAVWGTGLFGALVGAGFDDPASESARAADRIVAEVGRQDTDLLVVYSSPDRSVDDPAFADAVGATLQRLRARPNVAQVVSYYDTASPTLVSRDRHSTYAAIRLADNDDERVQAVRPYLAAPGLTARVGGGAAINADINRQVGTDIGRAEMYSMPILLLLLIIIFRSVIAATTPLLVGGIAIMGAFTATRILTYTTDVSVFALNIITLIGLGMAVDYALFVVSRFREELDAGAGVPEAVERTLVTAGRTVAVSGLTVALALASLLLFPQVFLRSMGFGGMAAVLVAMVAALTVLPALLAVLGPRINAWRVPVPRPRWAGHGWERLAHGVMRRPVLVSLGVAAVLLVLAAPFARAHFGGIDERVLPAGAQSRVVTERIARDFPGGRQDRLDVLVSHADPAPVVAGISALPHVTDANVVAARDGSALIAVSYDSDVNSTATRDLVAKVRALPDPVGGRLLVGGSAAELADLLSSLAGRLPLMALLAGGASMLLLFLAFGSLALPVKAVVMNLVSIGASFGAIVWVFQDGHLSGLLGFTPTGALEPTQLILILAILFGLSTDYEVFLLSRVREEWDRTGDNSAAVAGGLARTGGIITSAALLLIIVVGGFATGGITFIKMIGVGMIVAIVVDATLVRALLVPATMRLLGRANWWLPGPLRPVYGRFGVSGSGPAAQVPGDGVATGGHRDRTAVGAVVRRSGRMAG